MLTRTCQLQVFELDETELKPCAEANPAATIRCAAMLGGPGPRCAAIGDVKGLVNYRRLAGTLLSFGPEVILAAWPGAVTGSCYKAISDVAQQISPEYHLLVTQKYARSLAQKILSGMLHR